MPFAPYDPSKYDFSQAALYRRVKRIKAADVEIKEGLATIGGGKGGSYTITEEEFHRLYIQDPDSLDTYISRPVVRALVLMEDTAIPEAKGISETRKGGVVTMDADGNLRGVEEQLFADLYGRADDDGKIFVRMNAPLTTQLKEATERGLEAHKRDIMERIARSRTGKILGS